MPGVHTHAGHQILLQNYGGQREQTFWFQNELSYENSKKEDMQLMEEKFPQNIYYISDHTSQRLTS